MFASGLSGGAVGLLLGLGVLGLFMGIALLAPRLVKPLARIVGSPARRAAAWPVSWPDQRGPQPRAHGLDGRRADDRAHARDRRGGARRRHEQRPKAAVTDQLHAGYVVEGNDGLTFSASESKELRP